MKGTKLVSTVRVTKASSVLFYKIMHISGILRLFLTIYLKGKNEGYSTWI